ncbi:MAG: ImmA/IrrE family metallo-endopeptidase [Actinomycetota bacterium]|nr:ImmA/IrrE family metallo-endopeptidase [Actinomycetota bacterium]
MPFVQVALRRDLPVSGLTNWLKPRWLILLSATEPEVRRRFSLMHEFKHILDHPFIGHLYPDYGGVAHDQRAELAADYFSACVLMPKRLVKRAYFGGQQNLSDLAAEFGVSEVAMRYRLHQLKLVDRPQRCVLPYRSTGDIKGYLRRSRELEPMAA